MHLFTAKDHPPAPPLPPACNNGPWRSWTTQMRRAIRRMVRIQSKVGSSQDLSEVRRYCNSSGPEGFGARIAHAQPGSSCDCQAGCVYRCYDRSTQVGQENTIGGWCRKWRAYPGIWRYGIV